jgi:predicted metal-dependent phosphoesterase TrpH
VPFPANFDFHAHSTVSDGLLSPVQVVARAAQHGVSHLALTDHDDIGGLLQARQAAAELGLGFVDGVEISAQWQEIPVHIVGLGMDAGHPLLQAGLEQLRCGRVERAKRMGEALERLGIPDVFSGALRYAANPQLISRAHFARYLVELGLFKDTSKVFEHYLRPGKPGYVEHRWASLSEAMQWLGAAGGVAVVAHPGRYPMSGGQMRRFLADFKDLGGTALEVVCSSHSPDQARHFAHLARQFAFHASRGSDFHGPDEKHADFGRLETLPEDLKPVWRLLPV